MMQRRVRPVILLVAEAVTLAHYARISSLSRALDPSLYDIVIAADPRYRTLDAPLPGTFHALHSIPSSRFAQALAQGRPVYDTATLSRYVEDDLALFAAVKPDLVIGDFRLSLAVSAPLARVPYAAVVNAYWSPYADIAYPVPDLPFTHLTGLAVGQKLFDLARPLAFALHARPLNQVRRRYGLAPLDADLRYAYTWGDYTLYADIPELVPMRLLPDTHRFIGPVLWSAQTPLPSWWEDLPEDKPVVFLTPGSSGRADLLPLALRALARLPVTIIAASAGQPVLPEPPVNAYIADYLPMQAAARRASLLISNGGSLTAYQALACGVPVIGLCTNMDQLLNMGSLERLGAGVAMRAGTLGAGKLQERVAAVLARPAITDAAKAIGGLMTRYDAGARFRDSVAGMLR